MNHCEPVQSTIFLFDCKSGICLTDFAMSTHNSCLLLIPIRIETSDARVAMQSKPFQFIELCDCRYAAYANVVVFFLCAHIILLYHPLTGQLKCTIYGGVVRSAIMPIGNRKQKIIGSVNSRSVVAVTTRHCAWLSQWTQSPMRVWQFQLSIV